MNRKASLSLSISAIVVIVIAFVVLGLGLSLTRSIFKSAEEKLPEAIALTQLEAEPTSSNPITIQQQVEIPRSKSKNMNIGYYNRRIDTALGAKFSVSECLDTADTAVEQDNLPRITSGAQDVEASSASAYSIIITENGLPAGTYVCTVVICNKDSCDSTVYEQKQFFLRVTA